jgi:hypothetical protein
MIQVEDPLGQAIWFLMIGIDDLFESSKSKKGDEMRRFIRIFFLAFFILAISASSLLAMPVSVPEIDPSLASSAIALITGGLLILKSKSKRK